MNKILFILPFVCVMGSAAHAMQQKSAQHKPVMHDAGHRLAMHNKIHDCKQAKNHKSCEALVRSLQASRQRSSTTRPTCALLPHAGPAFVVALTTLMLLGSLVQPVRADQPVCPSLSSRSAMSPLEAKGFWSSHCGVTNVDRHMEKHVQRLEEFIRTYGMGAVV